MKYKKTKRTKIMDYLKSLRFIAGKSKRNTMKLGLIFVSDILISNAKIFTVIALPKNIIDLIQSGNVQSAIITVGSLLTVIALLNIGSTLLNGSKNKMKHRISIDLNIETSRMALSIPYDEFEKFEVREEYEFAQKCIDRNTLFMLMEQVSVFISSVITFSGVLYIVSVVTWWIWLLVLAFIIINIIGELKRMQFNFISEQDQNVVEMKMCYSRDHLTWAQFAKEVRLYLMENYITKKNTKYIDELRDIQKERARKTLFSTWWSFIAEGIQMFSIYVYAAYLCMQGTLSIGDFTLVVGAVLQLSYSVNRMAGAFVSLREEGQYIRYLHKFLSTPVSPTYKNKFRSDSLPLKIEFDNVGFKYYGSDSIVLEGITVTLQLGRKYSIVGLNGAGKTTFVKLLMGLYKPTQGRVFLSGYGISEDINEGHFDLFSPVFQDFTVFHFNILDNIALSNKPKNENVEALINKSSLANFIDTLPQGLNTFIHKDFSEGGIDISGGQQQMLALLRAIYKNAPIFILDEPTAALSAKKENELYSSFDTMTEGKTVFYISHRLASCRLCDEILVFDKGRIVENGSHDVLMKKKGLYSEMYVAQSKNYMETENEFKN